MVHLFTCLILSTLLLLAQLSCLAAAQEENSTKNCCPGDSSCSGCWMCPESDLRNCWDAAVQEIDQCHITDDLPKSADTFCRAFAKLAQCWSAGRCCSEYAPLLAAATNLCNLKTWSPQLITRDELEKFITIANATRNAIWHNDSGVDVPKLTVSVEAYNNSVSSQPTQPNSSENTTNPQTSSTTQHTYAKKSADKNNQPDEPEEDSDPSEESDYSSDYGGDEDSPEVDDNPQANEEDNKSAKNQQEGCTVEVTNRPTKRSGHYHQTRWSKTKNSLSRRVENPLHKRAMHRHHNLDLFKRTEEGDGGCGLDFQGVPYPQQVPETVAHVFAEL
ncbi:hypothetical protein PTTG_02022 [Puccinia triticina 1-1 BBBD Race 1]|uniref:Extracellular membrane protein CFEM domain-containing protein n=2 Tax=Puccinia triticina TaxID=208348 RepID=A0A0C4EMN2_PUCT1|nr:uncharacterized protein PtA15_14A243 [Puccinia triticina]OAV95779.1 hypothetical protein PTTG_02022 [Puccinia triticina 1-1 BBBD Race 1]WAQ91360.1 hypothetical protein PtA15_14A243 [Puccinia triticina]WAR62160.1 hypothetical protein PtB15_14B254 [Puccinia triticina]